MEFSNIRDVAYRALDFRSAREDMISSNIANVDTPFYRSRDISFSDHIYKMAKTALEEKDKSVLEVAKTNPNHLEPWNFKNDRATIFLRDGHMARNDGNTVDLDVETTELSKNSLMYSAVVSALKRQATTFKSALDAARNV